MKNKERKERLDGKYVLGIVREYQARMRDFVFVKKKGQIVGASTILR